MQSRTKLYRLKQPEINLIYICPHYHLPLPDSWKKKLVNRTADNIRNPLGGHGGKKPKSGPSGRAAMGGAEFYKFLIRNFWIGILRNMTCVTGPFFFLDPGTHVAHVIFILTLTGNLTIRRILRISVNGAAPLPGILKVDVNAVLRIPLDL